MTSPHIQSSFKQIMVLQPSQLSFLHRLLYKMDIRRLALLTALQAVAWWAIT